MSTSEIQKMMDEQMAVAKFENKVHQAMDYVAKCKGILVGQKVEIIDELRCLSRESYYGFHIESGVMVRCNKDSKAYDNKSNNPMSLAQSLVKKAYNSRKEVA